MTMKYHHPQVNDEGHVIDHQCIHIHPRQPRGHPIGIVIEIGTGKGRGIDPGNVHGTIGANEVGIRTGMMIDDGIPDPRLRDGVVEIPWREVLRVDEGGHPHLRGRRRGHLEEVPEGRQEIDTHLHREMIIGN